MTEGKAYVSDRGELRCISTLMEGETNNVYLVQGEQLFTMISVKDRSGAKRLAEILEGKKSNEFYTFCAHGEYCVLLPYEEERRLEDFLKVQADSWQEVVELCKKLVFELMSSELPYPFLYLVLREKGLNISSQGRIYFSYVLNINRISQDKGEKECAGLCGRIVEKILKDKDIKSLSVCRILSLKNNRSGYGTFQELYQDLNGAVPVRKRGRGIKSARSFVEAHRHNILRALKIFCIVLSIVAAVVIISELVFDENPFARLFFNSFKVIGTESMTGD